MTATAAATATAQASPEALPRWNMSTVYAGLEAADYRSAFDSYERQLEELTRLFDDYGVRQLDQQPTLHNALADLLGDLLGRINKMALLGETLEAFINAFYTTNSYDAVAERERSRLELADTRRKTLMVRLEGWLGSLDVLLGHIIPLHKTLRDHAFYLKDAARRSRYLMSEDLEALAAELVVDGGSAFGNLQGRLTSQVKVPFELDGETKERPITVIRNLSNHPDGAVRERAYRAEIEGWKTVRTGVAAALNAVKGTAITLARRRGRDSVLDEALDKNRIDRATLDAMMGAIRDAFPMFRRYLQSKAQKLGKAKLPWWDLTAPVGSANRRFGWSDARDFIAEKIGGFSEEAGAFCANAFLGRWIDAEPRDGKVGGAYCMPVPGIEESRILANFDGSFDEVSTLAHELGHGFHNYCQKGLEPLRRGSPATLAETASIFFETLICEAAVREGSPEEQLAILETQLCGASAVCVDISSRFQFETEVFARRAKGALSADELCALILEAQADTYADGLDRDTYHPYMWLWKPHYYAYDYNFYNFPYAFGHLFGLGLYAIYLRDGKSFVPRYKELLRSTGQELAAPLAERFGLDIRKPDFWRGSLAIIGQQVERYEALGR